MKKIIYKIARFMIKLILPSVRFGKLKIELEEAEEEISKIYQPKELFNEKDIQNLPIDENIDLSIIVPVYNSEKFLKKCMNSIVNQKTKYHFEVIAINDGSTDGSLEILKEYENQYDFIKVIVQENGGAAVARNNGINHSRGRYLSFVDSDDFIDKSFIETMLDRALKNNLDITMCSYYEYDIENEKIICEKRRKEILIKGKLGGEILNLKGYNCMKLFKRELWNKIRQPEGFWYEDCIMRMILFRMCSSFEYIDIPLYYYTIHKNSISRHADNKKTIKTLDHYFLVKELLNLSNRLELKNDDKDILYRILLYELGPMLWLRTKAIDVRIQKQIFVLACDIIKKYKVQSNLSFSEGYLEKAFKTKEYCLWKLVSIYVLLGVKIGNE